MSYSRFACMRTSYFLSMVEIGWIVWKLASLRSNRGLLCPNMFIPLRRHETIPGLCWFTPIHKKVQGRFSSYTMAHYGDLSWGTVSALAVTISDGYRLKHVMHILTFSTRGAIPQSMVEDIPSLAKTHPDKVLKLSAGTCSSFLSWNCGHAN